MPFHRSSRERFFMGVDLGQSSDPTAIAVVRRIESEKKPSVFQLGFLERAPLGTPYPGIVHRVGGLMSHPTCAGNIELSIDQTGVGGPVADMFKAAGIPFTGVTITGGHEESQPDKLVDKWHVPKLQLISGVQCLLHEGRLLIQKNLAEAETLVRELQDFRVRYSDSGYMTFGAREGKHDDLVLALSIAIWKATRPLTVAESWAEFCTSQVEQLFGVDRDPVRPAGPDFGWSFANDEPLIDVRVPEPIASEGSMDIDGGMRVFRHRGSETILQVRRVVARELLAHPAWRAINKALAEELEKDEAA
jgi:hypothetical protein